MIGQEVYLKVPLNDLKKTDNEIENVHLFQDEESKVLSLFVEESKVTYGFQFDKDLNQIAQLTSEGLKRKYKEIIGQVEAENRVRLIQKNSKGNKFASILYDFKNQKTEELEYEIDFSNHKYLQSYSKGTSTYVFSVIKYTSILRKWVFDIDGNVSYEDIDLGPQLAEKSIGNLYDVLFEISGTKTIFKITQIENQLPNVLEIATDSNKMYAYNDGFYWTLDKSNKHTVLLDFKLPNLEPIIKFISKPELSDNNGVISNSYMLDEVIGQIVVNNREMHVVFKELPSLSLIKEYSIGKEDIITFKNGPILQEGSFYSFGATRKLEKASKFLRKISSHKSGLSIFKTDKGYHTIIGGVGKSSSGGGFGPGLPIGGIGPLAFSFNPASLAYGSYGSNNSTRIQSLFDLNFTHQEGEIPTNVLDEIELLSERWLKEGDNVYLLDDFVLFGNYQRSKKTFGLYKFNKN